MIYFLLVISQSIFDLRMKHAVALSGLWVASSPICSCVMAAIPRTEVIPMFCETL